MSAIKEIALCKDGPKYVLNFTELAKETGPLNLVPKPSGTVRAPQAPRYTSYVSTRGLCRAPGAVAFWAFRRCQINYLRLL